MPVKKTKKEEMAAMRREFHRGNQSIRHSSFQLIEYYPTGLKPTDSKTSMAASEKQ